MRNLRLEQLTEEAYLPLPLSRQHTLLARRGLYRMGNL
jgi:hypothetical protein